MAHGLLRESERAARRPALCRVLLRCPATPLPALGASGGGAGSRSLTGVSPSAAIRGCRSWSCFLRSPFCGHTEEGVQASRPGGRCARGPAGSSSPPPRPAARPEFPGRVPHARGAYLWLPPHRGSAGAGRGGGPGHPAARPEPRKFAGRGAGACARASVSACVCVCVRGAGGRTKSQVNTASPCRAKLINIQVAS